MNVVKGTRPLIGITGYYVERSEINKHNRVRGIPGEDMMLSPLDYSRSVEATGGCPVLLPVSDLDSVCSAVERLDGLLLAGGEDLNPWLYQERPGAHLGIVNPRRDRFELELIEQALRIGLPIFGICRGIQLLNVVFGGSLYQDLPSAPKDFAQHTFLQYPKGQFTHPVDLQRESLLHGLFGKDTIWVNSFHHQGINRLGSGLKACAVADDGLVEGLEGDGHSYLVAVQWHPETLTETTTEHLVLFRSLVDAARDHAQRR